MKTILLIEDNQNFLENLIEYFELEGYKILCANNALDGIAAAIMAAPDLVICDVLMNKVDGYKVLQLLLENPKTHKIPFIFSTSNSEKVDRKEALALGADDYIIKPFELEALLRISKKWITSGSKRIK